MATWIDLFAGPAGLIHQGASPETGFKASVHEWKRHGFAAETGDTHVSGTGGLDELQPLSLNGFANFGGKEHKWDAGIIRFTVGDALNVLDADVEFGVHFNTIDNTNSDDPKIPEAGDNTGYALFVKSLGPGVAADLTLYRIVGTGKVPIGDLILTRAINPGDTVEVRWGYSSITGMTHGGAEWGIKVFVGETKQPVEQAVIKYDGFVDPGDDTPAHLAGGNVGVCRWAGSGPIGENFITEFEFTDLIRRLSDPSLTAVGTSTPFRSPAEDGMGDLQDFAYGLYTNRDKTGPPEELGEPTNNIPGDWLGHGTGRSNAVQPLTSVGEGEVPQKGDPGVVGFVSIGVSNSGQIWSALTRMANDPGEMLRRFSFTRNPTVRFVNGAKATALAKDWAEAGTGLWHDLFHRLNAAGLPTDPLPSKKEPPPDPPKDWTQVQVQVVWLSAAVQVNSNDPENVRFPLAADVLSNHLVTVAGHLGDRFPNLRMILCSDLNTVGWVILFRQKNSEPVWLETMRYGYKQFIDQQYVAWQDAGKPTGTPWVGWWTELWDTTAVWEEKFFPEDDNVHPNAEGEEYGADRLLVALDNHEIDMPWWNGANTEFQMVSFSARDDGWTRNDFSNETIPDTRLAQENLHHRRITEDNKFYRVYLKFNIGSLAETVRQAYLQLSVYGFKESHGSPFTVRRVDSLWFGSVLTARNAPAVLGDEEASIIVQTSTTHPVTVDVTELVQAHAQGTTLPSNAGPLISFVIETRQPATGDGATMGGVPRDFRWYSRGDTETTPNRGPQLILVVEPTASLSSSPGIFIERGDEHALTERS